MELLESDFSSSDELIDRFVINITKHIGERHCYSGFFNLAEIEITVEVAYNNESIGDLNTTDTNFSRTTGPGTIATGRHNNSAKIVVIVAAAVLILLVAIFGIFWYKYNRTMKKYCQKHKDGRNIHYCNNKPSATCDKDTVSYYTKGM